MGRQVSTNELAALGVIAVAPLAIVLIVAMLRSYTITLHMTRDVKRSRRRRGSADEGD